MKKTYVKSLKEYEEEFELDAKKILEAMKRYESLTKKFSEKAKKAFKKHKHAMDKLK